MKIMMCRHDSPAHNLCHIFPVIDQYVYMHWLIGYIFIDLAYGTFHLTGVCHGSKRVCGLFLFTGSELLLLLSLIMDIVSIQTKCFYQDK